jgi:hypothetical protein
MAQTRQADQWRHDVQIQYEESRLSSDSLAQAYEQLVPMPRSQARRRCEAVGRCDVAGAGRERSQA